ncbi:MAG TPA: cupin domain-containing protein [Thermomicrobiales bacterium]|nr:cupin domain-containing protein [Thermomicrobiales bacterium]
MPRVVVVVAVAVVFGTGLILQASGAVSLAQQATPETSSAVVIASEVLGRAAPVTVENPELALGRVTIMPGAAIPTHYHVGTQIGVVAQGELTYEVFTGEVALHRKDDPTGEPYMIGPAETVVVRPGDALVETPESIHQGSNEGDVPLVIYLSTLFPAEAPRSVIVEATPIP